MGVRGCAELSINKISTPTVLFVSLDHFHIQKKTKQEVSVYERQNNLTFCYLFIKTKQEKSRACLTSAQLSMSKYSLLLILISY